MTKPIRFGFKISLLLLANFLSASRALSAADTHDWIEVRTFQQNQPPLIWPAWFDQQKVIAKKDGGFSAAMAAVVKSEQDHDPLACLKAAASLLNRSLARTSDVQPWIALKAMTCAALLPSSKTSADLVMKTVGEIEKHPEWLFVGVPATRLRLAVVKVLIASLEQDSKTNRTRAEHSVERAQVLLSGSDEATRAKLWAEAGELAFVTQKMEAAQEFFTRSLLESGQGSDSEVVRQRLHVVENALGAESQSATRAKSSAVIDSSNRAGTGVLAGGYREGSDEEIELADRVGNAMKAGELVNAVSDAVKLIREFPGSVRAKWANDRVLDCYRSIDEQLNRDGDSLRAQLAHGQILSSMKTVDGERLAEWAKQTYSIGAWADSLALVRAALNTVKGAHTTSLLDLAAKAALAIDDFKSARQFLDQLVLYSAGQPLAREALFRSGLLHYRRVEYVQAGLDFERALLNPQVAGFELPSRYWLWRSLQKQGSDRATEVARGLMIKAPLSYYGLRVRLELAGGTIEWKKEEQQIQSRIWLTRPERHSWDRAVTLLAAGWYDEADAELETLPPARHADDKAIRALMLAAAGGYQKAIQLANQAWDENPELRQSPLIDIAFPQAFESLIAKSSQTYSLDRFLVASLIKQESGFNLHAVSSSNAMGLMQMIPPTAREIAQDLKLGALNLPGNLFEAPRNVQMGTYYLSRLLGRYQGHVPLALASYNAGPARIGRWLKSRASLKDIATLRTSDPDVEIWFDELPYQETSLYVKAILRNLLVYRLLDQGRVGGQDPLWAKPIAP